MKDENLPILIAKDKNAKICKDDYKIGWLFQDEKCWLWTVWGSSKNIDSVKNCAKQVLDEQGDRIVYFSKNSLERDNVIQGNIPDFEIFNLK